MWHVVGVACSGRGTYLTEREDGEEAGPGDLPKGKVKDQVGVGEGDQVGVGRWGGEGTRWG